MPINEFDVPSRFTPIDASFYLKQQERRDKQQKESMDLLDPNKFIVKGGYGSQTLAKEYNQEVVAPVLEKYATKIATGEPLGSWYKDYVTDVTKMKTDPVYNFIKEDEANMANVQTQVKDPTHPYSVQDYYDTKTGKFHQATRDEVYSGLTVPMMYSITKPKDVNPDFEPEFKQVKEKLEVIWGSPIERFTYDDKGNAVAVIATTEGKKTRKIEEKDIDAVFRPYVEQDFEGLLGAKQSLKYNKAVRERQNPGYIYDKEEALNDIKRAYLGYFNYQEDLQPRVTERVLPKKTSGSGGGSDLDVEGLPPNEVSMTLNKLGEIDSQGNVVAKTKARNEVITPIIGGRKVGDNFVVPFDSNNPPFLQVPKNISGSSTDDDFSLAKALPYQSAYNQAREDLVEQMEDIQLNQVRNIIGLDKEGNEVRFSYLGDGTIGIANISPDGIPQGWVDKISLDEFINEYLPNTELAQTPNGSQLSNLASLARDKFGIDLSDPETQDKIIKMSKTKQGKAYQEVAQALSTLTGNHEFFTDPSSDNIFLDETGTPIVKGYVILNENELAQIFPNYKRAVTEGVISKYGFAKDVNSNATVSTYKIPVYKGSDADPDNVTQTYVDEAYGKSWNVDKIRQSFQLGSRSSFDNLHIKKAYHHFSEEFNASKDEEPLRGDLMDAALQLSEVDRASADQAIGEIRTIYDNYLDKKSKVATTKKELYMLYLAIQVKIAEASGKTEEAKALRNELGVIKQSFK